MSEREPASNVIQRFRERAARCREQAGRLEHTVKRVGAARLALFVVALLLGAEAIASAAARTICEIGAAIAIVALLALVRYSDVLTAQRRRVSDIADINEQAAFRAERDWTRIVPRDWSEGGTDPWDLDIFGPRSLVQLLPPTSVLGRRYLQLWFLDERATTADITRRQEAVRELVDRTELREQIAAFALRARTSADGIAKFVEWATAPREPESAIMNAASFAMPALTVTLLFLRGFGVIAPPLWLLSVAIVIAINAAVRHRTRAVLRPAEELEAIATTYAEIIARFQRETFQSAALRDLELRLGTGTPQSAGVGLRTLGRTVVWAQNASPMLHAALQATLMWDWHLGRRLDRWRATFGASVDDWLGALGELESFAALAALSESNPDWAFPDVEARRPARLEARALGHPLLPASSRVSNDVEIGPPGTVEVISGSNMSGKSTLLRAVGVNIVLARAGGPVCAASLSCPPVQLRTSIQIHDSLQEGVSYFMAEIRRLKTIIDAAEEARSDDGETVVYLIDEMLRGTNSAERAVAVQIVVHRLLEGNAIGIVTAHDLPMFDHPAIAPHARHQHLGEMVESSGGAGDVGFDYHLHPGPTKATNALKLLALAGITPI